MEYVSNAFSLGMLPKGEDVEVVVEELSGRPYLEGAVSVVGHPDTAAVLGLSFNRQSVTLHAGDVLFVAQLEGGRLPEGATVLPQGASFRWFRVDVLDAFLSY